MSKPSKLVLVLGLVAALLGGTAGPASADDTTPGSIVTVLLGPGVCC